MPWQSPSGGERRALVSSAGPPGGAVEVDLSEGRGSGQADAHRRRRPHPAAAAELLHGVCPVTASVFLPHLRKYTFNENYKNLQHVQI